MSFSAGLELQVLGPGVGYGIIAGIGAVFTGVMILTTQIQNRYSMYSTKQSEEFNTASRSVKPGLIAAGIVSSWTWAATLLTSATFAYTYGISGPMWYAAMGSSQVLIFAVLSLKIKRSTPGAHTFPEIILSRHGKIAHAIFLLLGWITNMFVSATLVLGGSQVISGLSGVNVYAASFIIPLAVAAYVIQGGLRSTFVADYLHTVILFVAILTFAFSIYATNDYVGSPRKMYDLLTEMAVTMPIEGNAGGSYLTFQSQGAGFFAAAIFLGGFSTVWLDQAYWQRAIASRPETSAKAYLMGGLAWYGIPFGFATAMGLGCVALTGSPSFPTYPNPLTPAQDFGGFSAPAAAIALMGKGGAALMLLLLFMAITSATSAELIAVSSLWTFDVYKLYINPKATSHQLVNQSHIGIGVYSLLLAAFSCVLSYSGVGITWLLTTLGVITGGGGIPVALVMLWPKRMSTAAVIGAPVIAFPVGLTAWLVTTSQRSGAINVTTTGDITNSVAGSAACCGTGLVLAITLSFLFPKKYESSDPAHIARVQKINGRALTEIESEERPRSLNTEGPTEIHSDATKKESSSGIAEPAVEGRAVFTGNDVVDFLTTNHIEPIDLKEYKKAEGLAIGACVIFVAVAIVAFPVAFAGSGYIFSKAAFEGWVVVSLIWVFFSAIVCIGWPIWESFSDIKAMMRVMIRSMLHRTDTADHSTPQP